MKYWILTSEYPPFYGGGISTYCFHTSRMLMHKGHEVSVFINDNTVRDVHVEYREQIRIIRFNPTQTNAEPFLGHITNISYEFAHIVKRFIEQEGKPDVIEAQEYLGIAYYLLQYKHLQYSWCKDLPVIITMHSPSFIQMEYNEIPNYRYPNWWICEMEKFCLQAADLLISPTDYLLREVKQRFDITNKNIVVVPNPFPGFSHEISQQVSKPTELVFYGKLTAQKGAFRLLKYFKELWDNGFARSLVLLGGQEIVYHPENRSMGDIINKQYDKYIKQGLLKLEDKLKPGDVPKRLSSAEVVIIPSNNDNLPYVVFEMMALGKIVLASRQGGQVEVIEDEKDGFLFDHNTPTDFARQLNKILSLDSEQRNEVAKNAISKISGTYNSDVIYQQKMPYVEKLVSEGVKNYGTFPFVLKSNSHTDDSFEQVNVNGKLSVIVPYYNLGKYLPDTINSLLNCNYPDYEIIIVNDGSSEQHSLKVLDNYRKHPKIKILDLPNGGLSEARNKGAQASSNEFISFLDADDTVHPDYHSQAIRILKTYRNVHFVGCWTKYFDSAGGAWPAFSPEPPLILYHNLINSSAIVVKRASFLAAGKNDTELVYGLEDYESIISMTAAGLKGVVIPELLFNYRVRPDSMFRKISKERKLLIYQYIARKHKDYYSKFADEVFNLVNANGPGIALDNPTLDLNLADKSPFGAKVSLRMIRYIKKNPFARRLAYKLYSYIKK